jgi:hypothetical protein
VGYSYARRKLALSNGRVFLKCNNRMTWVTAPAASIPGNESCMPTLTLKGIQSQVYRH